MVTVICEPALAPVPENLTFLFPWSRATPDTVSEAAELVVVTFALVPLIARHAWYTDVTRYWYSVLAVRSVFVHESAVSGVASIELQAFYQVLEPNGARCTQ